MAAAGPLGDFVDSAPPWDALADALAAAQSTEERAFRPKLKAGEVHDALTLLRLVDGATAADVRVKFYRDSAAWCPYCQKVWIFLEEKRVSYVVEKVPMRCYGDKPRSYTARYGQLLPAAEIDGQGVTESNDIIQRIEAVFPANPLYPLPATEAGRRLPKLLKLEREVFGAWLQWLTSPGDARAPFEAVMGAVERELAVGGPPYFLSGCPGAPRTDGFSIADVMFAPFLERIAASMPYFKGLVIRRNPRWPNLDRWYDAMDGRPAYAPTKGDFYTHCHDLPPQLGGCAATRSAKPFQAEIDGEGDSWQLPLPDDSASLEPFLRSPNSTDAAAARREAAERLLGNRAAVVRFACRGSGVPGPRPVSAPLADPTAVPAEWLMPAVDSALRHVVAALLGMPLPEGSWGTSTEALGQCLQYLKDRVGVPRDMALPAARQLRAHLSALQGRLRTRPGPPP